MENKKRERSHIDEKHHPDERRKEERGEIPL